MHFKKPLFPVVTFFFFGGIAVLLWQAQSRYERGILLRHTENSAEQLRIRVEGLMNARIASLGLMAERWVEREPADFSQERFLSFAKSLYQNYQGFAGIDWIDPDGIIRWVFPPDTNASAKDESPHGHSDPAYRATFEQVRKNRKYGITPCMKLQGGMGFHVIMPLLHEGQVQGYLDGVFQMKSIMALSLPTDILRDFLISLYEKDRLIYSSGDLIGGKSTLDKFPVIRGIHFPGKTWRVEVEPRVLRSPGTLPVLLFGLALSVGLSVLLHFLLQRIKMLRAARDQALREVSERKRAEKALHENEKKLEALLAELAEKNTELESFVYTVSHDLKTPIVTIEGFVGALREDFGDRLSAEGEKYLDFMSRAARKMEMLINDLLELSRIGRLSEAMTRFPFGEIVRGAIRTLQPLIEARGVAVTVDENLPAVYGERKRLVQVMDNLLSNAVKYIGVANPTPRIHIGAMEQNGRKTFFVRDNGIGIEQNYLEKVFQIFQRLPSAVRTGEGTGIGLTIVQRIIEHHGGSIWLTSEPGKGSTFFFTLSDQGE